MSHRAAEQSRRDFLAFGGDAAGWTVVVCGGGRVGLGLGLKRELEG